MKCLVHEYVDCGSVIMKCLVHEYVDCGSVIGV